MEPGVEFVGTIHISRAYLKMTWKDLWDMVWGKRPHFSCCVSVKVEYDKETDALRVSPGGYSTECTMLEPGAEIASAPPKLGFEKLHQT